MNGSDDNFFANIEILSSFEKQNTRIHQNYFRFDPLVISLMSNQLSHTVAIEFIMCGSYKIALYSFLLIAMVCKILLPPVCARHVKKCANMLAYTPLYTPVRRITFTAIALAIHICSNKIRFSHLQKFTV